MPIGPDFDAKDRVKQATSIVDLVSRTINLRRQGPNYVGLCPWHDDKRPSFTVNPVRQRFSCFVCDLHGDVFDFTMKMESVDFRGALEILAQAAGIVLKQHGPKTEPGNPDHKPTLFEAMKWVEEQYHQCLLHSNEAIPVREYLQDRGITQESIDKFRVGFAPLAWSWLVDRCRSTRFTPKILEACGLILMNNRGTWYERFRGRVLFPIRDTQDRPIALGGRVVPGIYGTEDEPKGKYYNSTETRLFTKSDNLYGLNIALEGLRKADDKSLTIVEGYTDVIAAHQAGVTNVVAALGTALNERHIRLIKRFADSITLVLDGDDAGQRRTSEVLDLFVTSDVDLRILTLPEGMDPFDLCMKQGGEAFQKMIEGAPDAISHRIRTETKGVDLLNQTHAATKALNNILKTLAGIPASEIAASAAKQLRQQQLIGRLSRQFQIDSEHISRRLNEIRNSLRPRNYDADADSKNMVPAKIQTVDFSSFVGKERELLQLLILQPALLDTAVEKVSPDQFVAGPLKAIYQIMDDFFHDEREVDHDSLMLEVQDPVLRNVIARLYDEAASKNELESGDSTSFALDMNQQFDSVLAAFEDEVIANDHRAKVSQLQQKALDKEEELAALEELLNQTKQRHGL
ncbi:DNA primase [Mariniblastus fucicola]|uniref:DNA primase n=1 Tax=Mariniblastus fucicola TaxID=980251 RepID=A0A5B9P8Y3_9BACT|nr:DNA primase [Mariniblastus fucicola]QEG21909.1 DNA primase [Mariniblastus fucicola]